MSSLTAIAINNMTQKNVGAIHELPLHFLVTLIGKVDLSCKWKL